MQADKQTDIGLFITMRMVTNLRHVFYLRKNYTHILTLYVYFIFGSNVYGTTVVVLRYKSRNERRR